MMANQAIWAYLTQRTAGDPEDEKHEESPGFLPLPSRNMGGSPSPTLERCSRFEDAAKPVETILQPIRSGLSGKWKKIYRHSKKSPIFRTFFILLISTYDPFFKKILGTLFFPIGWTVVVAILCCLPGSMLPDEGGSRSLSSTSWCI